MKTQNLRSTRTWIVASFIVGPILYVLSIGPVARWAVGEEDLGPIASSLEVLYTPILLAIDVPVIGSALEFYIELWQQPEIAWSEICELFVGGSSGPGSFAGGASGPMLAAPTSVGVTRVFVGGSVSPTKIGVDFDFDVHDGSSFDSAIQLANFEMQAKASGLRFELKIARPPLGPEASTEPAILLASADEYTEWSEMRQRSGMPPAATARVFELRGNVRIKDADESLELQCDQATIEFVFEQNSTTEFSHVSVRLGNGVKWKSKGFKVQSQELSLRIDRSTSEKSSGALLRDVEFSESARFRSENGSGSGDQISFEFATAEDFNLGVPTRVSLKGNAEMSHPGSSGGKMSVAGSRIEWFPKRHLVNVDGSEPTE